MSLVLLPRVGWVPPSPDAAVASARIRCLNPVRELRRRGAAVSLARPDERYDVLVLSKKYDPATLAWAALEQGRGTRIVFDLCDNHFFLPDPTPALRENAERLRNVLRTADRVVVSTPALAEVVRSEAGVDPHVIGDAIEASYDSVPQRWGQRWRARLALARIRRWRDRHVARGAVPLVWFGAAGGPYGPGGMGDLARIRDTLEALAAEGGVCLTVISNSASAFRSLTRGWRLPVRYLDWNAATIAAALRAHAVAVIPITRTPFTVCKSSNRVATALWHGLAVVADEIPSYRPFAGAVLFDAWDARLRDYLRDSDRRREDVARGRRIVEQHCTITAIADQWTQLFESLA